MGSPELPNDPGDDFRISQSQIQHAPMPSDDSENESDSDGYQPLPTSDEGPMEDNNLMEEDYTITNSANMDEVITPPVRNLPPVESVDVEVERQVWNEPRPQELQIELDNTRTTQILNAMANFTLPNVVVPEWANGVPEERWKEELLQRIRQRKEGQATSTSQTAVNSIPKDNV